MSLSHFSITSFSRKLRSVQLSILLCYLAILNILDVISGMLVPILSFTNGSWLSDMPICRWNLAVEQVNVQVIQGNHERITEVFGKYFRKFHLRLDNIYMLSLLTLSRDTCIFNMKFFVMY